MKDEPGIISFIQNAGVRLWDRRPIVYTPHIVHALYDHMSDAARRMLVERFDNGNGLALLLDVRSIEHILGLAGRESDPGRCAPGTIRARFGTHGPASRVGDWDWWDNAFHRPVDEREAARDRALFFSEADG